MSQENSGTGLEPDRQVAEKRVDVAEMKSRRIAYLTSVVAVILSVYGVMGAFYVYRACPLPKVKRLVAPIIYC